MFRTKIPFTLQTNVEFSVDNFFTGLQQALCVEQLFYNLPVTISQDQIPSSKNDQEYWQIISITVNDMSHDEFNAFNKMSQVDVLPKEKFHIAFNITKEAGKDVVINFSTNLRAEVFRKIMYAVPSFTKSFFLSLKQTEYFIYDESISDNVRQLYAQFKSNPKFNSLNSNYTIYHHAILNTPNASCSSLYFANYAEIPVRMGFTDAAHIYHMDILTAAAFLSPTDPSTRAYVAQHIVQQLADGQLIAENQGAQQLALYVGAAYGENIAQIQKAYQNVTFFGVEPASGCVQKYQANKENLFWMNVEDLLNFSEMRHAFDYIFVLNYNVLSNQTDFFDAIYYLIKQSGKLIVGQAFADPFYTTSPVPYTEDIKRRFQNVEFVKIVPTAQPKPLWVKKNYGDFLGWEIAPASDQKTIYANMADLIKNNGVTVPDNAVDILASYAEKYKQFLYCATGPKSLLETKERAESS
ncbi:MAG TPA: hypothetical protein VGU44_01600, partial [Gammaproteobacteria bacterium]|nr:hypothetical protein [Gammaproteobacteria bacterium]